MQRESTNKTIENRQIVTEEANLFVGLTETGDASWQGMGHTKKVVERDHATDRVHAPIKSLFSVTPRKAEAAFINSVGCPF